MTDRFATEQTGRKDESGRRIFRYSPVAQSVEQVAVNHRVGGSSPSRGANIRGLSSSTQLISTTTSHINAGTDSTRANPWSSRQLLAQQIRYETIPTPFDPQSGSAGRERILGARDFCRVPDNWLNPGFPVTNLQTRSV